MRQETFVCLLCFCLPAAGFAKQAANYDESKVGNHPLPALLTSVSGEEISSPEAWLQKRRPALLRQFALEMFGSMPEAAQSRSWQLIEQSEQALDGKATRKQISMRFSVNGIDRQFTILLYVPNQRRAPAPAFLGLNFRGNQTIHADSSILMTRAHLRNRENSGIIDNRATSASRGKSASRWPVEMIIDRGFALVTACYAEIAPDDSTLFRQQITARWQPAEMREQPPGAIAVWAWGLRQILDYLRSDADINGDAVAVFGHSRLGKTALWAGALDPRFALVISNNSGCGGAALSRRNYGETLARINSRFPHWFNTRFKNYSAAPENLPFDQHMLIALIAPRPVYVASASEDRWADPKGEYLSAWHAGEVYRLFGAPALQDSASYAGTLSVGYHLRNGRHNITAWDWQRYLDFADAHFKH